MSVSQGCCSFKPRGFRHHKSAEGFHRLQEESDNSARARFEGYESCLSILNREMEALSRSVHSHVISSVASLVFNSYSEGIPRRTDVPVAVIVSGFSNTEGFGVLEQLMEHISQHVTPHIALLSSKDCQNMKNLMKRLGAQLMFDGKEAGNQDPDCEGEESDSDSDEDTVPRKESRRVHYTMPVLCAWYQEIGSSHRISETTGCSSPVVVVFEDFEGFSPALLGDFLETCSHYVEQLPLFAIFGIQTSANVIDHSLPRSALSVVHLEEFRTTSAGTLFDKFVDKVLQCSELPFKLGHCVLQELADQFLLYNHSINRVNAGLRVAMLEHFSKMPVSMLCHWDVLTNELKRQEVLQQLSHTQLEQIRSLQSFRKFVEESTPFEQKALLLDDDRAKESIDVLLADMSSYQNIYRIVANCLHRLTCNLPMTPLGNQLWELYVALQTSETTLEKNLQTAISILRQTNSETLLEWVGNCLSELKTTPDLECLGLKKAEMELCQKIEALQHQERQQATPSLQKEGACSTEDNREAGTSSFSFAAAKTTAERKMQLQKNLRKAKNARQSHSRHVKEARNQLCDWLETFFKSHLRHPKSVPLNEVFFFSSALVQNLLNPTPRAVLHRALTDPYSYLRPSCHRNPNNLSDIDPQWPDTCIAYKLHEECSRLINLYDWMQAFISVVGQRKETPDRLQRGKGKRKKKAEPDTDLHARFIRAVSELQFLGFVKPSKRKTDHVERLTWGLL